MSVYRRFRPIRVWARMFRSSGARSWSQNTCWYCTQTWFYQALTRERVEGGNTYASKVAFTPFPLQDVALQIMGWYLHKALKKTWSFQRHEFNSVYIAWWFESLIIFPSKKQPDQIQYLPFNSRIKTELNILYFVNKWSQCWKKENLSLRSSETCVMLEQCQLSHEMRPGSDQFTSPSN